MVLIFSESDDYSTNKVIDWLRHYEIKFLRLNDSDTLNIFKKLELNNLQNSLIFEYNNISFDLNKIEKIWFRRGQLNINNNKDVLISDNVELDYFIKKNLNEEINNLKAGIYDLLSNGQNIIGNPRRYQVNKIKSLKIAASCGLNIPETLITSDKKELQEFKKTHTEIITKGIQEVFSEAINNGRYLNYTTLLSTEIIDKLPETFFPSLFQKKLNKKYELRIFYWEGQFFSMAIFSQLDKKTEIDFRNFNNENPNRMVPYKLPEKLQNKLTAFMNTMKLNTGSIDIVVTSDNAFVFLEVNPVGQYDFLSKACNYFIDREIAKKMCN